MSRFSTGVPGLDELLGGGLVPGTLTVVCGATGIGKTQLGLQFCNAGLPHEGRRGIVFDMSARGDAQSHREYARRMIGHWKRLTLASRCTWKRFSATTRRPATICTSLIRSAAV
jgi:KaiC/GvpD/RAD55 family RecA-like ATPase